MTLAYFDCFSGISGNMIIGALLDAGLEISHLKNELKKLQISKPACRQGRHKALSAKTKKQGIAGTYFEVIGIGEEKNNRNLQEITSIINKSRLSDFVKGKSSNIFYNLAKAEAKVHGTEVNRIHFHEVGAIDSIVDVVGACIGFELLGIQEIYCSAIPINRGFVKFSHGKLPLPAPAVIELLKNIPVINSDISEEIVTPTGAAIISTLAKDFGYLPQMKIQRIGYGAGSRNLDIPNMLRVLIGEKTNNFNRDTVLILETNIDDMNAQIYDLLFEKLFSNGALDVYLTNIQMKKNRPAVKLSVLTEKENLQKISKIIFSETTSIGLRIHETQRYLLKRQIKTIKTKFGNIRVKIGMLDNDIINYSPEYEDCKIAANKYNVPLKKIFEEISKK